MHFLNNCINYIALPIVLIDPNYVPYRVPASPYCLETKLHTLMHLGVSSMESINLLVQIYVGCDIYKPAADTHCCKQFCTSTTMVKLQQVRVYFQL